MNEGALARLGAAGNDRAVHGQLALARCAHRDSGAHGTIIVQRIFAADHALGRSTSADVRRRSPVDRHALICGRGRAAVAERILDRIEVEDSGMRRCRERTRANTNA